MTISKLKYVRRNEKQLKNWIPYQNISLLSDIVKWLVHIITLYTTNRKTVEQLQVSVELRDLEETCLAVIVAWSAGDSNLSAVSFVGEMLCYPYNYIS